MTIAQYYQQCRTELSSIYESREAENIADWIFEEVTGLKKWQRRNATVQLSSNHLLVLEQYISLLMQHKPVQYVLGYAWFYKRKFFVNENVLIPRPETEELVSWIVQDFPSGTKATAKSCSILDIGTGSGCIAISLKKELPDCNITAIDVSEGALAVAKKNGEVLHAEINFQRINFLEESESSTLSSCDIIVSNPPYIPANEENGLAKNVVKFEPHDALFVPDNDPFLFYRRIAIFAHSHLTRDGNIYVEIHEKYSERVAAIFAESFSYTEIKKDIYGKDRMIKAGRKNQTIT
ncbi:MAG: peptide chain release factor N(5)-glutamine methyltransferase [Ginsengibacter sp.]